jgi:HSP20 family protein
MRSIVRWEPFAEMEQMRFRMDRIFGDLRPWRLASRAGSEIGYVPLDVSETDEAFEVEAALPGVKPEDVEVQVHGDTVTIKGEAREVAEEEEKDWLRRERRYGVFARSFTLPTDIDAEKATAEFENGLLKLRLPKSEAARPKTIKVSTRGVSEGEKS